MLQSNTPTHTESGLSAIGNAFNSESHAAFRAELRCNPLAFVKSLKTHCLNPRYLARFQHLLIFGKTAGLNEQIPGGGAIAGWGRLELSQHLIFNQSVKYEWRLGNELNRLEPVFVDSQIGNLRLERLTRHPEQSCGTGWAGNPACGLRQGSLD